MRVCRWIFVLLIGLSASSWGQAATRLAVPAMTSPLLDQAGFLSPYERSELQRNLLDYSVRKGSQIAVLIVPSVISESTYAYGARVMQSWKLGRKGIDDGVLLLLVTDTRQSQLLVGRGLEGAIPDAAARLILQQTLRPLLQNNQNYAAIQASVRQIERAIDGEKLPATQSLVLNLRQWVLLVSGVLLLGLVLGLLVAWRFGCSAGNLLAGIVVFVPVWWMGGALLLALVAAVVQMAAISLIFRVFHPGARAGWQGFSDAGSPPFRMLPSEECKSKPARWSSGGGDYGGGGASGNW